MFKITIKRKWNRKTRKKAKTEEPQGTREKWKPHKKQWNLTEELEKTMHQRSKGQDPNHPV
jgi:hypothetical protein